MPRDPRFSALEHALSRRPGRPAPPDPVAVRAGVALLLRPAAAELELLLIRRAEREGDPWSGHVAFPGGRAQREDPDLVATAARETREEVGIDPAGAGRWLGALDELAPTTGLPRIVVAPHVFAVPGGAAPTPNHEVAAAFWVPLAELAHPGAATEYLHAVEGGDPLRFPAYGTSGHVVWGMTYRILSRFLELYAAIRTEGEP